MLKIGRRGRKGTCKGQDIVPDTAASPGRPCNGPNPARAYGGAELLRTVLTLKFNRALLCGCLQMMMVGMSRAVMSSARATMQPTLPSFSADTLRVSTTQMTVISVAAREGAVRGCTAHGTLSLTSGWAEAPTAPGQVQHVLPPTPTPKPQERALPEERQPKPRGACMWLSSDPALMCCQAWLHN